MFATRCAGCNQPGDLVCHRCRFSLAASRPPHSDSEVVAALPFDGVARQLVLGLKYRNRRGVARLLARLIVRRVRPTAVDLVTWAPTSATRARRRGYDQAELLARALARELGVPCRRLLYRAHGAAPQTGLARADRLGNPAFRARTARRGLRVLLVDDVVTTGGTLAAAAAALRDAGFDDVVCIAAAATPSATRPVQSANPAQARTTAMASVGSSSTSTPRMPTDSAAATFDGTSSRKAVRSADAPSLLRAS